MAPKRPQVGFMNYKDINGDGIINGNDVTLMYDKTTPVFASCLTLTGTYKTFRLQVNMNLAIGGKRTFDSEARKAPTTTQNAPAFWAACATKSQRSNVGSSAAAVWE